MLGDFGILQSTADQMSLNKKTPYWSAEDLERSLARGLESGPLSRFMGQGFSDAEGDGSWDLEVRDHEDDSLGDFFGNTKPKTPKDAAASASEAATSGSNTTDPSTIRRIHFPGSGDNKSSAMVASAAGTDVAGDSSTVFATNWNSVPGLLMTRSVSEYFQNQYGTLETVWIINHLSSEIRYNLLQNVKTNLLNTFILKLDNVVYSQIPLPIREYLPRQKHDNVVVKHDFDVALEQYMFDHFRSLQLLPSDLFPPTDSKTLTRRGSTGINPIDGALDSVIANVNITLKQLESKDIKTWIADDSTTLYVLERILYKLDDPQLDEKFTEFKTLIESLVDKSVPFYTVLNAFNNVFAFLDATKYDVLDILSKSTKTFGHTEALDQFNLIRLLFVVFARGLLDNDTYRESVMTSDRFANSESLKKLVTSIFRETYENDSFCTAIANDLFDLLSTRLALAPETVISIGQDDMTVSEYMLSILVNLAESAAGSTKPNSYLDLVDSGLTSRFGKPGEGWRTLNIDVDSLLDSGTVSFRNVRADGSFVMSRVLTPFDFAIGWMSRKVDSSNMDLFSDLIFDDNALFITSGGNLQFAPEWNTREKRLFLIVSLLAMYLVKMSFDETFAFDEDTLKRSWIQLANDTMVGCTVSSHPFFRKSWVLGLLGKSRADDLPMLPQAVGADDNNVYDQLSLFIGQSWNTASGKDGMKEELRSVDEELFKLVTKKEFEAGKYLAFPLAIQHPKNNQVGFVMTGKGSSEISRDANDIRKKWYDTSMVSAIGTAVVSSTIVSGAASLAGVNTATPKSVASYVNGKDPSTLVKTLISLFESASDWDKTLGHLQQLQEAADCIAFGPSDTHSEFWYRILAVLPYHHRVFCIHAIVYLFQHSKEASEDNGTVQKALATMTGVLSATVTKEIDTFSKFATKANLKDVSLGTWESHMIHVATNLTNDFELTPAKWQEVYLKSEYAQRAGVPLLGITSDPFVKDDFSTEKISHALSVYDEFGEWNLGSLDASSHIDILTRFVYSHFRGQRPPNGAVYQVLDMFYDCPSEDMPFYAYGARLFDCKFTQNRVPDKYVLPSGKRHLVFSDIPTRLLTNRTVQNSASITPPIKSETPPRVSSAATPPKVPSQVFAARSGQRIPSRVAASSAQPVQGIPPQVSSADTPPETSSRVSASSAARYGQLSSRPSALVAKPQVRDQPLNPALGPPKVESDSSDSPVATPVATPVVPDTTPVVPDTEAEINGLLDDVIDEFDRPSASASSAASFSFSKNPQIVDIRGELDVANRLERETDDALYRRVVWGLADGQTRAKLSVPGNASLAERFNFMLKALFEPESSSRTRILSTMTHGLDKTSNGLEGTFANGSKYRIYYKSEEVPSDLDASITVFVLKSGRQLAIVWETVGPKTTGTFSHNGTQIDMLDLLRGVDLNSPLTIAILTDPAGHGMYLQGGDVKFGGHDHGLVARGTIHPDRLRRGGLKGLLLGGLNVETVHLMSMDGDLAIGVRKGEVPLSGVVADLIASGRAQEGALGNAELVSLDDLSDE